MPTSIPPKFDKPRILLIDVDKQTSSAIRDAGFNVSIGTFGTRLIVPRDDTLHYLNLESACLPDLAEQEIIILNTKAPAAIDQGIPAAPGTGVKGYWQYGVDGVIDPRPFIMAYAKKEFDRLVNHEALFIILLDSEYSVTYFEGVQRPYRVELGDEFALNNIRLLDELRFLSFADRNGADITFNATLLTRGAKGARFGCIIEPRMSPPDWTWEALATNKYQECVAGLLIPTGRRGAILLLPQMPSLGSIILPLLENWGSAWNPNLFPHHGATNWLHASEYEQPAINTLVADIEKIKADAAARIAEKKSEIDRLRATSPNWYALLSATGRELVEAVMDALAQLGFTHIVDVDAEDPKDLREDLRIEDANPPLVVDVKGVIGTPEDDEATQSTKHALMRARDNDRYYKPLTIINSQRNLPPKQRNQLAYREPIIDNARESGLGLMTTWDLFLLLRNKERLGWDNDNIKPLFTQSGRIKPIPTNYALIGTVAKVWNHSFGLIPQARLEIGDLIAVEHDHQFYELQVSSLQSDGAAVKKCDVDSNCGIKRDDPELPIREGQSVYLVTRPIKSQTQ